MLYIIRKAHQQPIKTMKPIVLLIENDAKQAKTIRKALEKAFPEIEIITLIDEESAITHFGTLTEEPYFVASDVMLPWFDSSRSESTISPPADYPRESGFRLTGTRLWKEFRKKFPEVIWVYFTILDPSTINLNENTDLYTGYVQKDGPVDPFIREIRELLSLKNSPEETDEEISARLWNDPSISEKLLKGIATPIEECWKIPVA